LEPCINANIIELTNKLVMYQTVFNNACIIIKYDILYLSADCIRSDFISTYIKDYNFKMDDLKDEEIIFTQTTANTSWKVCRHCIKA